MPTYPSINDRESDLWKKIAWNLYQHATSLGITGLNSPSINDNEVSLKKKVAYYTASLA